MAYRDLNPRPSHSRFWGVVLSSIVRRVQFTGKSTYIISLPKDWARSIGITRGSKVFIEIMPDNSLRIRPEPRVSEVKLAKIVDLGAGLDINTAMREIIAAYIAGFESFRVNFNSKTSEAARKLRSLMDAKLANVVLVDESVDSFTYKVVGPPKPLTMMDATSWLSRLVNNTFSDLLRGLRDGDIEALKLVMERDDLVDKAYLMVTRYLTKILMGEVTVDKAGISSHAEAVHYYHAFKTLERIADHLSTIASESTKILEAGGRIESSLVKFLEELSQILRTVTEALVDLDVETARSTALQIEILKTKLGQLLMATESLNKDARHITIITSIGRLLGYSLDLAEIVFDIKTVKTVSEALYE
jgi:phosphate uptake regulator